uniref:Uncharacterized protein n=1 Tax=Ditylenchus dipsaci TaxID=166011 RepID=A0A915EPK7_9BILA
MAIYLSNYIWQDIADFFYLRTPPAGGSGYTNSPSTHFLGTLFSCRPLTNAMLHRFNFLFQFYTVEEGYSAFIGHLHGCITTPSSQVSSSDLFCLRELVDHVNASLLQWTLTAFGSWSLIKWIQVISTTVFDLSDNGAKFSMGPTKFQRLMPTLNLSFPLPT